MNLSQLRMFATVARHLNMTSAAEELHVSQPAVSQQLRRLETECDVKFYSKTRQGVELTEEGRKFLEAIQPVLIQLENIEQTFGVKRERWATNCLAVGGTHGFSANVLPRILMAFRRSHPRVRLVLETGDSRTLERRILKSELEIALITNPSHSPDIEILTYEKQRVIAFVSASSPLAKTKPVRGQATGIPLVIRKDGKIERVLREQGYGPNIAMRCENSEAVKAAARMGIGIGIALQSAVERELKRGDLKLVRLPAFAGFVLESCIAYSKLRSLSRLGAEFLRVLLESRAPGIEDTAKKASVA